MLLTRNTCNKKFATVKFQRTEKDGDEIYLWYHETWRLTSGSNFQARNDRCWMYIDSQGEHDLWIHLQWVFIFLIQYTKNKFLRVWCQETWNEMERSHWRWIQRNRDGHDILNFTGEKRPNFDPKNLVSEKPFCTKSITWKDHLYNLYFHISCDLVDLTMTSDLYWHLLSVRFQRM